MNKLICIWEHTPNSYNESQDGNQTECGVWTSYPSIGKFCPFCGRRVEYALTQQEITRFETDKNFLIFSEEYFIKSLEKITEPNWYMVRVQDSDNFDTRNRKPFRDFLKEHHYTTQAVASTGRANWKTYPIHIIGENINEK